MFKGAVRTNVVERTWHDDRQTLEYSPTAVKIAAPELTQLVRCVVSVAAPLNGESDYRRLVQFNLDLVYALASGCTLVEDSLDLTVAAIFAHHDIHIEQRTVNGIFAYVSADALVAAFSPESAVFVTFKLAGDTKEEWVYCVSEDELYGYKVSVVQGNVRLLINTPWDQKMEALSIDQCLDLYFRLYVRGTDLELAGNLFDQLKLNNLEFFEACIEQNKKRLVI